MSEKTTVRIETKLDRWRFTCPNGHRSWEPTNHHFWCSNCANAYGADGSFEQLRDQRDGRMYAREDVRLVSEHGPYDVDHDGGTGA
ncbi:hypothetical protein OB920_05000 [Halobacteria archaeon HArc-gm2]|nr:hypothetical protein [Halobacteria archaeon HArc-gm2]